MSVRDLIDSITKSATTPAELPIEDYYSQTVPRSNTRLHAHCNPPIIGYTRQELYGAMNAPVQIQAATRLVSTLP